MLGPPGLAGWAAVGRGTLAPSPPWQQGQLGLAGRDAKGHRDPLHRQCQRDGSDPQAAKLSWSKASPTWPSVLSPPGDPRAAGGGHEPGKVS